jgi:hypothetical protein
MGQTDASLDDLHWGNHPFLQKARSIPKQSAFIIIYNALNDVYFSENRDPLIRERFEPEMAKKLASSKEGDEIEGTPYQWDVDDGPREVTAGYFVFATNIDWYNGIC